MKRITVAFAFIFSMFFSANAQQDPQWSQFMYDNLSINPGSAGTSGSKCFSVLGRTQWVGFTGHPRTLMFNGQMPVRALKGGVGLTVYTDHLGFLTNNALRLSYSYHKTIPGGIVGGGIGLGFMNSYYNPDIWIYRDLNDPTINQLPETKKTSAVGLDMNAGIFVKTNKYYVGISATRITEPNMGNINTESARHYYLMGGYTIPLKSGRIKLKPAALLKTDGTETQIDLNVTALYNNRFWGGLTFRPGDAIAPMVGFMKTLDKGALKVGYSYDITVSSIGNKNYDNRSRGSHELVLTYCIIPEVQSLFRRAVNPRLLK